MGSPCGGTEPSRERNRNSTIIVEAGTVGGGEGGEGEGRRGEEGGVGGGGGVGQ